MPFVIPAGNKDGPWSLMAEFTKENNKAETIYDNMANTVFRDRMEQQGKEKLASMRKGAGAKPKAQKGPNYFTDEQGNILIKMTHEESKTGYLNKSYNIPGFDFKTGQSYERVMRPDGMYKKFAPPTQQQQPPANTPTFSNGVEVGPQSAVPLDLITDLAEDVQYG